MSSRFGLLGSHKKFKVLKLGHETLRKPSSKIMKDQFGTKDLRQFVRRMKKTLKKKNGIGLAAPQVGENLQVFIAKIPEKSVKVFINPSLPGVMLRCSL